MNNNYEKKQYHDKKKNMRSTINKKFQGSYSSNSKKQIEKLKITKNGKKVIKTGAALLLLLASVNSYIEIKEIKKQFDISEDTYYMSEKYRNSLTGDPEEIAPYFSKEERQELQEFFKAIKEYKKYQDYKFMTDEEKIYQDAKRYIADYAESSKLKTTAEKIVSAKMRDAKLYGDFKYEDIEDSTVEFINDKETDAYYFEINGVNEEIYNPKKTTLFNNEIPDNLRELAEDILDYDTNMSSWNKAEGIIENGRKECEKDAISMGEVLEKALYEYYIIDKNGNIVRISQKEFEERANKKNKNLQGDKVNALKQQKATRENDDCRDV